MSVQAVVIDDDKVTRTMLEKSLKKAGISVDTAMDGKKGKDLIKTNHPKIVIMDMLIPQLHGLDLCRQIREDPLLKDITIILISAVYKDPQYKKDIHTSGADYFVEKPLDMDKLLNLIKEILEKKEE